MAFGSYGAKTLRGGRIPPPPGPDRVKTVTGLDKPDNGAIGRRFVNLVLKKIENRKDNGGNTYIGNL